jgi:hypothetical protein
MLAFFSTLIEGGILSLPNPQSGQNPTAPPSTRQLSLRSDIPRRLHKGIEGRT